MVCKDWCSYKILNTFDNMYLIHYDRRLKGSLVADTAFCLFVSFDLRFFSFFFSFLVSDMLIGQVSEQTDAGTLDKVKMQKNVFLTNLQIRHFTCIVADEILKEY